jgi:hypothetical protein
LELPKFVCPASSVHEYVEPSEFLCGCTHDIGERDGIGYVAREGGGLSL